MPRIDQSLRHVSLYIRITDAKGRRYERVNRRNPQTGGIYCLHFYENGKRKWESVGTDLNAASAARLAKESELLANPQPKTPTPSEAESLLENAIETYLANITALKSKKTADGYAYTLNQFKASCAKARLADIRVQDLRDFIVSPDVGHATARFCYYRLFQCSPPECRCCHERSGDVCLVVWGECFARRRWTAAA
jgi:hypothetical protein